MFGHSEGYGTSLPIKYPIQPRLGVFSETALKRYDFAVYAAGKVLRRSCIAHALLMHCLPCLASSCRRPQMHLLA